MKSIWVAKIPQIKQLRNKMSPNQNGSLYTWLPNQIYNFNDDFRAALKSIELNSLVGTLRF